MSYDGEDTFLKIKADTPFAQQDDYYLIARSAFGDLYLWGTRTGNGSFWRNWASGRCWGSERQRNRKSS